MMRLSERPEEARGTGMDEESSHTGLFLQPSEEDTLYRSLERQITLCCWKNSASSKRNGNEQM